MRVRPKEIPLNTVFKAIPISEHVYWVGAIDWTVRDFHGYSTPHGTSYNAYLIVADKITLIDTVKAQFRGEMLARIASVVDPKDISYIVSNHAEMDHSGCLVDMIELCHPEQVYASALGAKALAAHFQIGDHVHAVKDGETITLGDLTLNFMETRMLHWPDSMFSYLERDQLLFSQDAFGMHIASFERFADEISSEMLDYEAAKYFANILMPFSTRIAKVIDKLIKSDVPIKIMAPDHGPIWRNDPQSIVKKYAEWTEHKPSCKAVVVFDTMWQSTEKMARAICEGLSASGAKPVFLPMSVAHRSDVATEILDAGALIVGTPTLNEQIFPTVADVLSYLKGLKPQHMIGAVFGSYGWNSTALDDVKAAFDYMKIPLVAEPLKVVYVPDSEALQRCYDLGMLIGDKLTESCK
jgi:flavorubredoxin